MQKVTTTNAGKPGRRTQNDLKRCPSTRELSPVIWTGHSTRQSLNQNYNSLWVSKKYLVFEGFAKASKF